MSESDGSSPTALVPFLGYGVDAWAGMHSLRHSAGTRLYAETGDLEETALHLAHTKRGTTRIYATWNDRKLRETQSRW